MLHEYKLYNETDIENVNKIYFDENARENNKTQAAITNTLLPIQQKYNDLNQEQRYQFRKMCRTFVKWYAYIIQITRMFDKPLHKEYIFCSYLAKVLPADPATPFDLGNRIRLEFYNLQKTFEGSIELVKEQKGEYGPAKPKNRSRPKKRSAHWKKSSPRSMNSMSASSRMGIASSSQPFMTSSETTRSYRMPPGTMASRCLPRTYFQASLMLRLRKHIWKSWILTQGYLKMLRNTVPS